MTIHQGIQAADRSASMAAMIRCIKQAVDIAEAMGPGGQAAIGEALSGALDTVGAGAPQYAAFGDMRADAAFWADCATPVEVELYAAAALQRIERTTFAERARKRIFMALWRSFTDQQRVDFIKSQEKPP